MRARRPLRSQRDGAAPRRHQHVELVLEVEARELHKHAGEMRALLLAARGRRDNAVTERCEIDVGQRLLNMGVGDDTSRESFGQDQLVLAGQAQPIDLAAVMDDDLARSDEEVAAVDLVALNGNHARRRFSVPRGLFLARFVGLVGQMHLLTVVLN